MLRAIRFEDFWGRLQRGGSVTWEGRTVLPDAVLGPPRPGLARSAAEPRPAYPPSPVIKGIDRGAKIVLAGLWTSVCIAGPALSAIEQGFTSVMMDGSLKADGKTPAQIAALFDTVYVSFYKGIGALPGNEKGAPSSR